MKKYTQCVLLLSIFYMFFMDVLFSCEIKNINIPIEEQIIKTYKVYNHIKTHAEWEVIKKSAKEKADKKKQEKIAKCKEENRDTVLKNTLLLYTKPVKTEIETNFNISVEPPPISSVSPNFVIAEPGVSNSAALLAEGIYVTIPEHIRTKFQQSGWRIIISNQSLRTRFNYPFSVAGNTNYASKTVYLDNRTSAIKRALVHEIGHAIDDIYGIPSLSAEFVNLYHMEKGSFYEVGNVGDNHGTSNSVEYFASIFDNIILTGDAYYHTAPNSYNFVRRYMN